MSIKKIEIPNEFEWKKSLQKYIKNDLVPRFLPINEKMSKKQKDNVKKMRSIIASDEAMTVWVPAFTHPSFNSMIDQNFEIYEYLGDRMLSYALGVYMKKKYPNSNQDNLNNFDTAFTSRKPLADVSIQTGLIKHVRTIEKLTTNKEISDIFESVVGAITKIGDEYISPGIGFVISYNYITSVYNWYDDLKHETGATSYVNQVMQGYYDSLGWRKAGETKNLFEDWDKQTQTMTLFLNEKAIKMLTQMGNPPKNVFLYQGKKRAVLATYQASNKKEATDGLYKIAFKNLQTIYKINPKETKHLNIKIYFNELAKNEVISKSQATEFYNKIRERMRQDGFLSLKVRNYDTKSGMMFVLYGIMADEIIQTVIRGVFKDSEKTDQSRYYLYKSYIDNGPMKNKHSYYSY